MITFSFSLSRILIYYQQISIRIKIGIIATMRLINLEVLSAQNVLSLKIRYRLKH